MLPNASSQPELAPGRRRGAVSPPERVALGELHLTRCRLDELLAIVAALVQTSDEQEAWERVEQAARLARRAVAAAIDAVPPAPATPALPRELRVGELRVDTVARRQWYAGSEFRLTPLRHRLLAMMAARPTRVFGKDELRREIWGYHGVVHGRSVDTQVAKLRRDLIAAGAPRQRHLIGQRGIGWSLLSERVEPRDLDATLIETVRR